MNKNIEKEYKVLVTKQQFEKLLSGYNNITFNEQVNTYYDTLKFDIRNMMGAMRIRKINNTFLFTLKIQEGKQLLEFEKEVEDSSVSTLQQKEIVDLLSSYDIYGPFREITKLTTKRAIYHNGFAEICFDINSYNGKCDYEIEYEYKKEHDGLTLFQKFLNPIYITYKENCESKIKRAFDSLL